MPKTQTSPSEAKASPKTVSITRRRHTVQQEQPQTQEQAQYHHRRQPVRIRTRPAAAEGKESAPFLLKLLSWLGIILLCFVIGYIGTSWFMDFLNKKLLLKPENRIENQEDLNDFQEAETDKEAARLLTTGGDIQQVSLNLYHVRNDTIAETRKNFVSRTREDNIRDAVEEILTLSEVPNVNRIKLLHVFISGHDGAFCLSDRGDGSAQEPSAPNGFSENTAGEFFSRNADTFSHRLESSQIRRRSQPSCPVEDAQKSWSVNHEVREADNRDRQSW